MAQRFELGSVSASAEISGLVNIRLDFGADPFSIRALLSGAVSHNRRTKWWPTHWDRFNVGYDVSQQPAIDRLQSFIAEVKEASPRTEVIEPKYFIPVVVGPNTAAGK